MHFKEHRPGEGEKTQTGDARPECPVPVGKAQPAAAGNVIPRVVRAHGDQHAAVGTMPAKW